MNIETANRLLGYRKRNSLSQEELAEKIGVSRQAVSKWERAEASPDTDNLIMLSKVYGVSLDELLREPEPETESKPEPEAKTAAGSSTDSTGDSSSSDSDKCDAGCNCPGGKVSFDNGIHVLSDEGDKVDISFREGIHVDASDGTHVHIGAKGVHVVDPKGTKKDYSTKSVWYYIPFPIIITVVFLLWGFSGLYGGWETCWLSMLTIPLYYTTVDAIKKRDGSHFAYPVLLVLVYLAIGMYQGIWHPTWIMFLTVPIYYGIFDAIKKSRRPCEDTDTCNCVSGDQ